MTTFDLSVRDARDGAQLAWLTTDHDHELGLVEMVDAAGHTHLVSVRVEDLGVLEMVDPHGIEQHQHVLHRGGRWTVRRRSTMTRFVLRPYGGPSDGSEDETVDFAGRHVPRLRRAS